MCKLMDCVCIYSFWVRSDIMAAWLNSIYVIGNWLPHCVFDHFPALVSCLVALPTEDNPQSNK